jgi:GT2 family glycosyltransferase
MMKFMRKLLAGGKRKLKTFVTVTRSDGLGAALRVAAASARRSAIYWTGRTEKPRKQRRPAPQPAIDLAWRNVPPSTLPISVVVPVYDPPEKILRACLDSVLAQTHQEWQLCICDDASRDPATAAVLDEYQRRDSRIVVVRANANVGISAATNLAAAEATGEFIALLDHDDELHPQALAEIAHAIDTDPAIDVLYTDEDKLEANGRHTEAFFKPDWSPEYLCSVMYLLHCFCLRRSVFEEVGGLRPSFDSAQDYDLALRATAVARHVHHLRRVLYHWRKTDGSAALRFDAKPTALEAGRRALADAAARMDPPAAAVHGLIPGTYRLRRSRESRPPVTLVIISGDPESDVQGRGRIRILQNFMRSIVDLSTYPDYRILVADDGALSDGTAALMAQCGAKRVSLPQGDGTWSSFNYSRKVNFAIDQVQSEYFILLNDDLEVISPDWIESLMDYAVIPDVGVVGANLLFADGSTQHAGVICKPTGPDHVFYGMPKGETGYYGFSRVVRNYAAVTAAVMAGSKTAFTRIGPFDEGLAHDFNDIDFCLRACTMGYRVVYTPFSQLYHFEHASLKRLEPNREELFLFNHRWREWMESDPYYRSR